MHAWHLPQNSHKIIFPKGLEIWAKLNHVRTYNPSLRQKYKVSILIHPDFIPIEKL